MCQGPTQSKKIRSASRALLHANTGKRSRSLCVCSLSRTLPIASTSEHSRVQVRSVTRKGTCSLLALVVSYRSQSLSRPPSRCSS